LHLFDFENHRIMRIKPVFSSRLEDAFSQEQGGSLVFPSGIIQNRFWDVRPWSGNDGPYYQYFSGVYPVYNPGLFREAAELEKLRDPTRPIKKESGTFSYTADDDYNIKVSMRPEFFYSYDRGILVQNSAGTKHYGTELDKGFADNLLETAISANAFLTEGAAAYRAENMREFSNVPWAVRRTELGGAGIEVRIEGPANWLVIGNGFYHAEKPDLYEENSRPKEIAITYGSAAPIGEEVREHRVLLDGTFEMQFVPLLYMDPAAQNISIKILSVYPGTAYDDVCLNYIGAIGIPSLESQK
jgi:hypothetical protein